MYSTYPLNMHFLFFLNLNKPIPFVKKKLHIANRFQWRGFSDHYNFKFFRSRVIFYIYFITSEYTHLIHALLTPSQAYYICKEVVDLCFFPGILEIASGDDPFLITTISTSSGLESSFILSYISSEYALLKYTLLTPSQDHSSCMKKVNFDNFFRTVEIVSGDNTFLITNIFKSRVNIYLFYINSE